MAVDDRALGCPWTGSAPATMHYCEQNLCAWVTQPANTWSNFAYVLVAAWIWRHRREASARSVRLFAPIALTVGVASGLYHASYLFALQLCDLASMFLFSGLLLALNLGRAEFIRQRRLPWAFALATGLPIAAIAVLRGPSGIVLFAAEVVAVLALEVHLWRRNRGRIDYRNLQRAVALLVIAWGLWWLDLSRLWCDPHNHFVQGHALWHVVNALCFPLLFRFYQQFFKIAQPNSPEETSS